MSFNLQPTLSNQLIRIVPLKVADFEALYAVAADPLIWEQHPNKNRYQRPIFENFFEGALNSGGAFIIYDHETGKVVGSSRYYDLDEANSSILIGYTFIGRDYWGNGYNKALKQLMFDYAFKFVDRVILHIGASNFRSQKACEKLGSTKIGEMEVAYYGEPSKSNFVYQLNKDEWASRNKPIKN